MCHFITCCQLAILLTLFQGSLSAQSAARLLPFQGRLTDAAGNPLPDGLRVIRFQIFGDATSSASLWAGEVHRTTINGGLVNVQLGSKNPLPVDRPDDASRSFFDSTLYLEITVDSNGDGKLDASDAILTPRQAIIPVVFAAEAGVSRRSLNSGKLNGHDWSILFGTNDPSSASLLTSKIGPESLSAQQLKHQTITSNQIASQTVGAPQIADGAISPSKLLPRSFQTNSAAVGHVAISSPVQGGSSGSDASKNWFSTSSGTPVPVPGLSVRLETTGRPVMLMLKADAPEDGALTHEDSHEGVEVSWDGVVAQVGLMGFVFFIRADGDTRKEVASFCLRSIINTANYELVYPAGAFATLDLPGPGIHTYSVNVDVGQTHIITQLSRVRLVAFEL